MYKEHTAFKITKTVGLPLWRYMDFWKFLQLIDSSTIFFSSIEMMGDQHEGRIPKEIFELIHQEDLDLQRPYPWASAYKCTIEKLRKETLILSWTANATESFALWKMYAKEKLGIAIKTDVKRLKNSLKNTEEVIHIGEVNYYDPLNPKLDLGNTYCTFLNKHHYYSFESEVRCITTGSPKEIKIDLNELIAEVYISPFAEKSGLLDIINFLKQKNKLTFEIKTSGVNDTWI